MGEVKHTGLFVSSAGEIQSHTSEMGIWVPHRLPRRVFREIAEAMKWFRPSESGRTDLAEIMKRTDATLELITKETTLAWNWKNEDGSPLPQPAEDPNVWEEISQDEVNFVVNHITDGTNPPPKNPAA